MDPDSSEKSSDAGAPPGKDSREQASCADESLDRLTAAREARASRRFFLDERELAASRFRLRQEDEEHARRVLRLAAGDALLGLDGRGSAWRLIVRRVEKRVLELEPAPGEGTDREAEAGSPRAPLPWIEVALSLPRPARADEMVPRLVQLGASAIQPCIGERTAPRAPDLSEARRERLERLVRESTKQCGRLWLCSIAEPRPLIELFERSRPEDLVVLDPRAAQGLGQWIEARASSPTASSASESSSTGWTRARPLRLVFGPEGGWSPRELEAVERLGFERRALGPHVLRIETAAEAALAVVTATLHAHALSKRAAEKAAQASS